ncbi:hypothetical protein CY35_03G040700 [Sphagnum magellanicum]|nr:hypothetical protein CY35_03G040700 [Sphagnum magellanicum]
MRGEEREGVRGGRGGEMSTARLGGVAGGGLKIPPTAMEVVRSLKEIVENSDDEIYATLKECNMDLNETAQRLLNQAHFHEVKRRRDKKKEGGANKESADLRARPGSGGNPTRGGRGGAGRGYSVTQHSSLEYSSGRGKPFPARENGIHPSMLSSSGVSTPNSSTLHSQLQHSLAAGTISLSTPAQTQMSTAGKSGNTLSGSSIHTFSPPVLQGAWGSGHGTMADILRSSGTPPIQPAPAQASPSPAVSQPFAVRHEPPSEQSEFHSSSTDPVLPPLLDSQTLGAQDAIKHYVGTGGNQRPVGDHLSSSVSVDAGPVVRSFPPQVATPTGVETDLEAQVTRTPSPPPPASLPLMQNLPAEEAVAVEDGGFNESQSQRTGGIGSSGPGLGGSEFNGRSTYSSQQQPVGTQKDAQVPPTTIEEMGRIVDSLQSLNMQYQHPVVIPSHLQVPEADRTHLSFGSFSADFGTIFATSFGIETDKSQVMISENTLAVDAPVEQPIPSSIASPLSYAHQTEVTSVENLAASNDEVVSVSPSEKVTQPLELPKPDPVAQQGPHYPYPPPAANYAGFGLMPQLSGGQYGYETQDSQPPDFSRLPSLMQPYSDPASSYYTPAFRTVMDGDARYYVPSSTTSKYNGSVGLMTGPNLQASQENGKVMMSASAPDGIPASQPGNSAQTAPSLPQQPLPMHAYAAQPPLGHFGNYLGYQYLPPNYPYMHTTYQHNYGPSNNAYAQTTAVSSYPSTAVSAYPAGGSAPLKYSVPQYKPSVATGNDPHSASAISYESYTTTPSGYGSSSAGTASNHSGYDDIAVSQYKDNSLYIPSQQPGEGSAIWIQSQQLPQDMGPTTGTSSYYNLVGQGQQSAYAHSQQPAHNHIHPGTAYGNAYQPSQSAATPNTYPMLQQPQALGGSGASNIQAGTYQQAQCSQQTWTNNY